MNYKPFDLQKALAGESIIINGDSGKYQFKFVNQDITRYVFLMIGRSGSDWIAQVSESGATLPPTATGLAVMVPQKKTVWVNIWNDAEGNLWSTGRPFDTETEAANAMSYKDNRVGTYPIEIEI